MDETAMTMDPRVPAAFRRTRPWIRVLAIVSVIGCVLALIFLAAGVLGLHANPRRASAMIGMAVAGLLIGIPTAVVQVSYALALSDVVAASDDALAASIERACVRQRNAWIVNAIVFGLGGLAALFQTFAVFF